MNGNFSHLDAGTPESAWRETLDIVPTLQIPSDLAGLVVIAAHPDDETLGAGGLIAAAARHGIDVVVLIASDGEGSHPQSRTITSSDLARERRAEAERAIRVLDPSARVDFLGYPDGRLHEHIEDLARSIASEVADAARSGPGGEPVWLVAPLLTDGHPDHEACAIAARSIDRPASVRYWEYPIWYWHWATPPDAGLGLAGGRRFELDVLAQATKRGAVDCYSSQSSDLSPDPGDEAILSPAVLAHFGRPYEIFVPGDPVGLDTPPTARDYFDRIYAGGLDPWSAETRWYEERKRAVVLAALPSARYDAVFEPGCSTGLLTAELANRARRVVASDVAAAAVEATRRRVRRESVDVRVMRIPSEWPNETFDLIVLSEVAYYCHDLDVLAKRITSSISSDGTVVLCHWRHPAAAHVQTADYVHRFLRAALGMVTQVQHVEPDFLLDVLTVRSESVAERTGVKPA